MIAVERRAKRDACVRSARVDEYLVEQPALQDREIPDRIECDPARQAEPGHAGLFSGIRRKMQQGPLAFLLHRVSGARLIGKIIERNWPLQRVAPLDAGRRIIGHDAVVHAGQFQNRCVRIRPIGCEPHRFAFLQQAKPDRLRDGGIE